MRRGSVVQLIMIGVVAGAVASAIALVPNWLPEPSSREAGRIHFVFWFVTAISIAIFSIVASVILYAVFKFRARPDDDSDGPPIHGHTGLEIVWTAVPALLVASISVVSAIVLVKNDRLPADHMTVEVIAQQFVWTFKYDGEYENTAFKGLTTGTLRLPLNEPVELKITSLDVIHSFWVPEFSQKLDAVPGAKNNRLVITPDRLGTYPVICTELCGLGHPLMRTEAVVMPKQDFVAWVKSQTGAVSGGGPVSGKAVFLSNGCGACHTLTAAGATQKIGPNLDKLPASAKQAGKPLEEFIRESIVNPNAYIASGYPPNVMPSTFAKLPKKQLDALVQYLQSSKKAP